MSNNYPFDKKDSDGKEPNRWTGKHWAVIMSLAVVVLGGGLFLNSGTSLIQGNIGADSDDIAAEEEALACVLEIEASEDTDGGMIEPGESDVRLMEFEIKAGETGVVIENINLALTPDADEVASAYIKDETENLIVTGMVLPNDESEFVFDSLAEIELSAGESRTVAMYVNVKGQEEITPFRTFRAILRESGDVTARCADQPVTIGSELPIYGPLFGIAGEL